MMSQEQSRNAQHGTVQALDRALGLLSILAGHDGGLSLTQLARLAGLSPSTTHRLLATLHARHFVAFQSSSRLWRIGHGAFAVGQSYARGQSLLVAGLPVLKKLRDATRETANLGICVDGQLQVIGQIESREIERSVARVGALLPLPFSGMGQALLAAYAQGTTLSHSGDAARLPKHKIEQIAARGYAIDNGEIDPMLRCVAAPVYDHRGEPCCAISISGAAQRISDDRLLEIGRLVTDAALEMGRMLTPGADAAA